MLVKYKTLADFRLLQSKMYRHVIVLNLLMLTGNAVKPKVSEPVAERAQ